VIGQVRIAHHNRGVGASAHTVAASPAASRIDHGRLARVNLYERLDLTDPARRARRTRLARRLVHLSPQHGSTNLAGGGRAYVDHGRVLEVLLHRALLGGADHRFPILFRKRWRQLNVERNPADQPRLRI